MNILKVPARFIYLSLSLLFFVLLSCSSEPEKSDLIIKDNIIYKRGEEKPFTGIERGKVEDQIIEYEIIDGIKHGKFRVYYNDGTIAVSGQIDSNKNTGKWEYFFKSGMKESEGVFINDLPHGKWLWYYSTGKVKEEGNYRMGERIGIWTSFDEDGNLKTETDMSRRDSTVKVENDNILTY